MEEMKSNQDSPQNKKSKAKYYNKSILLKPIEESADPKVFDLCYYTYYGKLTKIVTHFNLFETPETLKLKKQSQKDDGTINCIKLEKSRQEVLQAQEPMHHRTPLHIAAYLNFANLFYYFLTYDADSTKVDDFNQNTWHIIAYRGHTKLLGILLNFELVKLKNKILKELDSNKDSYNFSNLDIVKGHLSRAVPLTKVNIDKFKNFQKALKELSKKLVDTFISFLKTALSTVDYNGQTPLHFAAMSKGSLCYEICNMIVDFDLFKLHPSWDDFLMLHEDMQSLEIKAERKFDPRRVFRLEREFCTMLGEEYINNDLKRYYIKKKKDLLHHLINIIDNNGDSALHISSFFGDYRIVGLFIRNGGKKKLKNRTEEIPVNLAKDNITRKVFTNLNKEAKAADQNNINTLVNFNHDINEKISIFSQAPIHKNIESQSENKHEVLKEMLKMGSDPNIKDSNGWTALHYACQLGDKDSVQILLNEEQIDVNSYSNHKKTPLHLACYNGYDEIVEELIKYEPDQSSKIKKEKVDLNARDKDLCTPLHLACKQGHKRCVVTLVNYKADLYALDFRDWNVLHYAAFYGHKDVVYYLCKYDVDYDYLINHTFSKVDVYQAEIERKSKFSINSKYDNVDKEVKERRLKLKKILPIQIVRDPSIKPYFKTIWHAAKEGDLDLVKNLLAIDDNDKDLVSSKQGNTPLHYAVMNNHYNLVRLLVVDKQANIKILNINNLTPGDIAEKMFEIIKNIYERSSNRQKDNIDMRNVIKEILNKEDDRFIDVAICRSNWNLALWRAYDFSKKINELLKEEKEKEQK